MATQTPEPVILLIPLILVICWWFIDKDYHVQCKDVAHKSITTMRIRFSGIFFLIIVLSLLTSGCGQKGPLFKPKEPANNQAVEPSFFVNPINREAAHSQAKITLSELPLNPHAIVQSASDNDR